MSAPPRGRASRQEDEPAGDAPKPLPEGTRVGKYVVRGVLGGSSLGFSYLAEQVFLGRMVKLEMLAEPDAWLVPTMAESARKLVGLHHPNISTLYDAGSEAGLPYVAWEFVPGWDLYQIVSNRGALPLNVALRLMTSMADAVHHAHEKGIVHGSISPQNIVLSPNGEPVLGGFWLATPSTFELSTQDASTLRTSRYASPEKAKGNPPTRLSDVWGLGVTLFFLVSGADPVAGDTRWDVISALLSPDPIDLVPVVTRAPEYVVDIVRRSTERDPARRYKSCEELRRALEAATEHLEYADSDTVELAPPKAGQTLLLHAECKEGGVAGSYREYVVRDHIASGVFGDVFRAVDRQSGEPVALKILKRMWLARRDAVERFRREARFLARLSHPNIVRVRNFGRYGGSFFIAMDLLSDRTLEDLIVEKGLMEPAECGVYVAQMLAGLECVHAAGAVHRDLKPSNVAISGEAAVLFDFGLVHVDDLSEMTVCGAFVGTPHYAAPEQGKHETPTGASDVYAAGVILYRMLTGRFPHEAEGMLHLISLKANEPPVPVTERREGLPPGIPPLLDAMLATDPAKRPSAAEAREALLAALDLPQADT